MFKMIMLFYTLSGPQPVILGEIVHVYDFDSKVACEEFKALDGWKQRTVNGFKVDAICVQVSEGV